MNKLSSNGQRGARFRARELASMIERDITSGRLGAGAWLKQIELEEVYGHSRLDVRQALEHLVERDVVESIPNRGYRVQVFTQERLHNVRQIRAILEVSAVESVIGKADANEIRILNQLAQAFSDAITLGTAAEQEECNRAFHHRLLRHCPNSELVKMIFDLRDRIPVAVRRENNTSFMLAGAAQEHFDMVTHLADGNHDALLETTRRHVLVLGGPHNA
ncbi:MULTISPECIES: GntR family transcriptional regulator [Paraburkholderia]|uniref:GntR family transcriptional regulator n=1 Tax=Paraburkholderia podalyriae TaxID=1938811 RepID=A0ABR7Q023_9BURK|nr:GntR family transcriptional regulator [Paraburkholderia podalyriae]MBC8751863.1 GntR family transcriptional regulator [Paraburkholderia podalyriae]